ncbi:MAG: histone deacetylase family protein [Dongiaceae bacterium]
MTILFTHEDGVLHDPGPGHPERIERLRQIWQIFEEAPFADFPRGNVPLASAEQLKRAHDAAYVDQLLALSVPEEGLAIDGDTFLSLRTIQAARRAAGAVIAAVDAVMDGQEKTAFIAMRPPGHHAEKSRACGFCFFNNVAVGAAHALAQYNLSRLAIVDFDVHHGNGTQDIFWNEPKVFYASTHQGGIFPGTGWEDEKGVGNILNVPLPGGTNGTMFRETYKKIIFPALDTFKPELLFISAGFDAHRNDPLASLLLDTEDFYWVTQELVKTAKRHAQGRVVSTLEGGYDLTALGQSVAAHVKALSGF